MCPDDTLVTCPSCAGECPEGARFCPRCGAALAVPSPHAVERKVVTTMFCDLVDFTKFCEEVDPEEADHVLREFFALARHAIETYGGVVEKFVGDAVVGVFGVPVAHEDDAERAVVTAVRLCDKVAALAQPVGRSLQVRIGVNTGTAVVRLDVVPGSGEGFLVGDAVNTAARLQKLAPPMGVAVGTKTYELTAGRVVYEELAPAAVKGKRRAVASWLAKGPISRMGVDLHREYPAPLVDREVELGMLRGLLKKVRAFSQPQFAIIVGEAGIGKSRLVFEFLRYVDSRPQIVRWRQGKCPAYGEGLTFWALSEIVREQLGVAEHDSVAAIEAKLADALVGQDDARWLAARLRPLLGLESPAASREENFAAWLRFFEHIASDSPAVLVLEDLHRASEATLAFLRYLVENAGDVPLLAVGTTRPELLRARPDIAERLGGFGAAHRGVEIDLKPLSTSETRELVALVGRGLGDLEQTRGAIVRRSAGNPLFAEQLVSHLEAELSAAEEAADVALKERVAEALPESLQSLIAARLDELPPDRKALLADAAVVGDVFWTGAVAALDHGDRDAAESGLDDLARHDMVRRDRASSVAGESQFAFRHALIRDVAYAQLTRAARAAKHAAVASWIEQAAGERVDEVAEILAHHYATALDLAETAGESELADRLTEPTVGALWSAGDRALPLDVAVAETHYRHALLLCPAGSSLEAGLLVAHGESLLQRGDLAQARAVIERGLFALHDAGDVRAEAAATDRLAYTLWLLGDATATQVAARAAGLLESHPASDELVKVMADWAAMCAAAYDSETAIAVADRALALGRELRLPVSVRALGWRGLARCDFGDAGGLDDMSRALGLAKRQGLGRYVAMLYSNFADELQSFRGPRAALRARREGLEFAGRRGDQMSLLGFQAGEADDLAWCGHWDAALTLAREIDEPLAASGGILDLALIRSVAVRILAARGRPTHRDVQAFVAWCRGREFPDVSNQVTVLDALVGVHLALGERDEALVLLTQVADARESIKSCPQFGLTLPSELRAAAALGDLGLTRRLAAKSVATRALDSHAGVLLGALVAEHGGHHERAARQYAEAAACWHVFGAPYEEAQALLGRGRCLLALGRAESASTPLQGACRVFRRLGAAPALSQAMRLLESGKAAPTSEARD